MPPVFASYIRSISERLVGAQPPTVRTSVVERTFAWLNNFRRLVVRWDHQLTVYAAFFHVALIMIALRALERLAGL